MAVVREPGKKRRPRGVATKRLYVIRLDPAVLEVGRFRKANPDHRPDRPCVYVGSTGTDPETRFEQHMAGYKAARLVRKYGLGLKQPMTRNLRQVHWTEAEAAERRLAARLRARGYAVWQN
jgi:predicted GIY-YIG superfamily endonuclease